ncbi:MAG: metallophosphoesterase [Clostridia bacterium]|nr:metallophosphoesterase [Clostridia bacterium]
MKKTATGIAAFILAFIMLFTAFTSSFSAAQATFSADAYSTIVTASDFQTDDEAAYNRFATVLGIMKKDGMPVPHSVLVGGDYSKMQLDIAAPGVVLIKNRFLSVYPDANPNSVVCIQGNHDNPSPAFAKTGLYDMGTYSLFCINEDSFPWRQYLRSEETVKKTASALESSLNNLKKQGDTRPVIVLTHVPLHHSTRSGGGDNLYSSYIFNVLNNAAKDMDIIFLFGHNHSSTYDDYIGGAVNFMKAGDTIRIPDPEKRSEEVYKEETLNFTYTNCGYIGYSDNSNSGTSTNKLTAMAIELCNDKINFIRYCESGLFSTESVERINEAGDSYDTGAKFDKPIVGNESGWKTSEAFWSFILGLLSKIGLIEF